MMRIRADVDHLRWFLAAILLASQLGCATSFKSIPPAQIPRNASPMVNLPSDQRMSEEEALALVAEIKGKMKAFYSDDARFAAIEGRLVSLEQGMIAKSADDARTKNNWAIYGGLFLPLGFMLIIGTMKPGGDPMDGQAFAEAYWLMTLPIQVLAGSLTGYILADNTRGPDVSSERQTELVGIAVEYNSLVESVKGQ
jgi:hypothetical protein